MILSEESDVVKVYVKVKWAVTDLREIAARFDNVLLLEGWQVPEVHPEHHDARALPRGCGEPGRCPGRQRRQWHTVRAGRSSGYARLALRLDGYASVRGKERGSGNGRQRRCNGHAPSRNRFQVNSERVAGSNGLSWNSSGFGPRVLGRLRWPPRSQGPRVKGPSTAPYSDSSFASTNCLSSFSGAFFDCNLDGSIVRQRQ